MCGILRTSSCMCSAAHAPHKHAQTLTLNRAADSGPFSKFHPSEKSNSSRRTSTSTRLSSWRGTVRGRRDSRARWPQHRCAHEQRAALRRLGIVACANLRLGGRRDSRVCLAIAKGFCARTSSTACLSSSHCARTRALAAWRMRSARLNKLQARGV